MSSNLHKQDIIDELSRSAAEEDPKNEMDFDDLPFHKQLSYREEARRGLKMFKNWRKKKASQKASQKAMP